MDWREWSDSDWEAAEQERAEEERLRRRKKRTERRKQREAEVKRMRLRALTVAVFALAAILVLALSIRRREAGGETAGTTVPAASEAGNRTEAAAEGSAVQETAVAGSTVPEPAAAETTAPETGASESAVPETSVPETAAPESGVSETAVPGSTVQDSAVAEIAVADQAAAETAVPDQTAAEAAAGKTDEANKGNAAGSTTEAAAGQAADSQAAGQGASAGAAGQAEATPAQGASAGQTENASAGTAGQAENAPAQGASAGQTETPAAESTDTWSPPSVEPGTEEQIEVMTEATGDASADQTGTGTQEANPLAAAASQTEGAAQAEAGSQTGNSQVAADAGVQAADAGVQAADAGVQAADAGVQAADAGAQKGSVSEEVATFHKGYAFDVSDSYSDIESETVQSSYALLVDVDSGKIIAGKNYNEQINPASMTKILTLLVGVEHLTEAQIAAMDEETFTITQEIADEAYHEQTSVVGWYAEDTPTLRDLLYGTILPSGADASMGLAEYTAGSQEVFVGWMNDKLKELGLSETAHFTNCIGLYNEDHYCTLTDMAAILKAALENDICREVLSTRIYTTTPTENAPEGYVLSNWFLRRIEDKDTNGEVAGAKTGFVKEAGNCAASYLISEGGGHYICVTANAWSAWRCIYDHVEIYMTYTDEE